MSETSMSAERRAQYGMRAQELTSRLYDRIVWVEKEDGGKSPTQWPDDLRRCSECRALMLRTDVDAHDDWHRDTAVPRGSVTGMGG